MCCRVSYLFVEAFSLVCGVCYAFLFELPELSEPAGLSNVVCDLMRCYEPRVLSLCYEAFICSVDILACFLSSMLYFAKHEILGICWTCPSWKKQVRHDSFSIRKWPFQFMEQ